MATQLTTIANVKSFLGSAGVATDGLIELLIGSVSAAIENYCSRSFSVISASDLRRGSGTATLIPKIIPVQSVRLVSVNGNVLPADAYDVVGDQIISKRGKFEQSGVVQIQYTGGLSNVPADVELCAIELVATSIRGRDKIGVNSRSMAGESVSYSGADFTPRQLDVLRRYQVYFYQS